MAGAPQTLQMSKEESDKKKGLLIFLDDSEKDDLGAISYSFLTALYQEAGSIIVSTSLLYTLFEYRAKDNRSINVIYNEVKKEKMAVILDPNIQKATSIRQKDDILLSKIAFQPDRWVIKKVNNSLSLLIPIGYLESLNIDKEKVKKSDSSAHEISDTELKLGLRVNHMETLEYQSMSRPIYTRFSDYMLRNVAFAHYFISDYVNYFVDSLDTIFCKKTDYKNKKDIPEWFIFMNGHGLINHSIADLSFYDFKQFLQFLDTKIVTKLLVVISCYVAGVNAETIYGDIKLETQQYYSFPIIAQGLNDVVTFNSRPGFWESRYNDKQIVNMYTHIDFIAFFKKAKELEDSYNEVIRPITLNLIENTPQIKLPGIEWFSVMEIDTKIVSIGSILAKTRDLQRPLDIVSFFKKDPNIILLYADNIPFELKIDSLNLKAIVSMASSGLNKENAIRTVYEMKDLSSTPMLRKIDNWLRKKAKVMASMVSSQLKFKDPVQGIQRIKKISSTMYNFSEMLHWFYWVASAESYKWILIDEISNSNSIRNKDILIVAGAQGITVYFKDKDNVLFKYEATKTEKVVLGSEDEEYYNERIRIIRNEYPQLAKKVQEARKEITSEQIKKIENVLIKQREKQKELATKSSPLAR